jgi:hypothetical protein
LVIEQIIYAIGLLFVGTGATVALVALASFWVNFILALLIRKREG